MNFPIKRCKYCGWAVKGVGEGTCGCTYPPIAIDHYAVVSENWRCYPPTIFLPISFCEGLRRMLFSKFDNSIAERLHEKYK